MDEVAAVLGQRVVVLQGPDLGEQVVGDGEDGVGGDVLLGAAERAGQALRDVADVQLRLVVEFEDSQHQLLELAHHCAAETHLDSIIIRCPPTYKCTYLYNCPSTSQCN